MQEQVYIMEEFMSLEETEELEQQDDQEHSESPPTETNNSENVYAITLNALCSIPTLNTIRVQGHIDGKNIRLLIDSGSTHGFINSGIATKHLGLPIQESTAYEVQVANGERIQGNRVFVRGSTTSVRVVKCL